MPLHRIFLIIVFTSFFGLNLFAADCKQGFCVGETVIDSDNSIGVILGFPEEHLARVSYNSSRYDVRIANLSKEVTSLGDLSKDSVVIDTQNDIGTVVQLFANGKVVVKYTNSSYILQKANLSLKVDKIGELKSGSVVIDNQNDIGTVVQLFANGKVIVKYGNSSYIVSKEKLFLKVDKIGELKSGSVVIDTQNDIGTVVQLFANGKLQVLYKNTLYIQSTENLSLKVDQLGELKSGSVVIDTANDVGTVVQLFANGKLQVQYKNTLYIQSKEKLSLKVDQLGELKSGVVVIDTANDIGTIVQLFANGKVQVKYSNTLYIQSKENLSLKVDQLGELKSGVVVLDTANDIGTIIQLFANGKVQVKYSNSLYIQLKEKLSIEVATHATYQKDTLYASNHLNVGKPTRFFKNGKIQHQNTIVSELFSSTDMLNDLKASDKIINQELQAGTVQAIYENGTIVYKLDNPKNESEKGDFSGKLTGFTQATDPKEIKNLNESEEIAWIRSIAKMLNPDYNDWGYTDNLVVADIMYLDLKKSLLERLKKYPTILREKKDLQKVMLYLVNSSDANMKFAAECKIGMENLTEKISMGSGISTSAKTTTTGSVIASTCLESQKESIDPILAIACPEHRFSVELQLTQELNNRITAELYVLKNGEEKSKETLVASQVVDPALSSLVVLTATTSEEISENRLSKKEIEKTKMSKVFATCSISKE